MTKQDAYKLFNLTLSDGSIPQGAKTDLAKIIGVDRNTFYGWSDELTTPQRRRVIAVATEKGLQIDKGFLI